MLFRSLGRIVEPRYVAMMNDMMHETLSTGTARKAELPEWAAAGKTGTSQDFRDGWFVGYTANLVAGVWLGNDDSSPTKKMTGGGLPAEIWARFMKAAHRNVQVANLPGLSGGMFFPTPTAQAPTPPMTVGERASGEKPARAGLDNWLLDRLFGRR